MTRKILCFGVVGSIGFLVDAGILTVASTYFDLSLFISRLVSFSIAVTVTWYLNRKFTFANLGDRGVVNEWVFYSILNGIGALINLSIFMWLVIQYDYLHEHLIVSLAIATVFSMAFNFLASHFVIFQKSGD